MRYGHRLPVLFQAATVLVSCVLFGTSAACPAKAGTYEMISQTGGEIIVDPDPYGDQSHEYSSNDPRNSQGGYGADHSVGGQPGSVVCEGTITTKFQWKPSFTGEQRPKNVVVMQTCRAGAGGYSSGGGGGCAASNGLGVTATPTRQPVFANFPFPPYQVQVGESFNALAESTKYEVQSGDDIITVICTPSASSSSSGGSAGASVYYSASVTPVEIDVVGVLKNQGAWTVLTGQNVVATFKSPLTVVPGTHQWGVSGGNPFADFIHEPEEGRVIGIQGTINSKPTVFNFYTADRGTVTISCSATLQDPNGQPHSAEAEAHPISSLKPTLSWQIMSAGVRLDASPPFGPSPASFFGPFSRNPDAPGQDWDMLITVPAPYVGGLGCVAQLATPQRFWTRKSEFQPPVQESDPDNGVEILDGGYPYSPPDPLSGVTVPALWQLPGTGYSSDTPIQSVNKDAQPLYKLSNATDNFKTWVMFQPPSQDGQNTTWVPLQKYTWGWSGIAEQTKVNNFWTGEWVLNNRLGAYKHSEPSETTAHPTWGNP